MGRAAPQLATAMATHTSAAAQTPAGKKRCHVARLYRNSRKTNFRLPGLASMCSSPTLFLLSRNVISRIGNANQRVRPGLDVVRKFPEILGYIAHVFEQIVNVIGVGFQRTIEPTH